MDDTWPTLLVLTSTGPAVMPGASSVPGLAQYGAIGILMIVLLGFSWSAIQRERTRADKAEARAQQLEDSMRTEVIPLMTRVVDAVGRFSEVVPEIVAELRRRQS